MRTLFIVNRVPFPLTTGSNQRVFHLLRAVAAVSEATLVCATEQGKEPPEWEAVGEICRKAFFFPVESYAWHRSAPLPRAAQWVHSTAEYLRLGKPVQWQLFRSAEGARLVEGLCAEGFDLIWVEKMSSLPLLPDGVNSRVVIDLDDLEHRKLGHRLRHADLYRSLPLDCVELLKLRRFERRLLRRPYELLVCSTLDRRALGDGPQVRVVPNGVDIPERPVDRESPPAAPVLLFVGTMHYQPNADAMRFFVRRVFPLVRQGCPQAQLQIVGGNPGPEVLELHDGRAVFVRGAVPRVEPYLERAAVVVAPIRFGGGTRIKILEAMAHRRPVVSTTVGAEGLEVEAGRHLLLADQPRAFAEACLRLLREPALGARLTAEGYELVRRQYDWRLIERRVQEIVLERPGPVRPEWDGTSPEPIPLAGDRPEASAAMKVSVIVPTRNRPRELGHLLWSLYWQEELPAQIVVVDQSQGDETRRVVDSFAQLFKAAHGGLPELVHVHDQGIRGAGPARNAGVERAEGDILAFLDDDEILEPGFLREVLAVYRRDPAVGGVSGVVTNYARPAFWPRLAGRLFWRGPFRDERQPIYWKADRLREGEPIVVRKFGAGVMSVRRSALGSDRFDGALQGVPPGEDVDLCCRLAERARLVIAPRARLMNLTSSTARQRDHWLGADAQATHYLYRRNWRRRLANRLCFAWLNVGYALLATVASFRRRSLEPWQALLSGIRRARAQVS